MVEIQNLIAPILEEKAKELLTAECGRESNDSVFDIYGNYNYPFEQRLCTPNTVVGSVGKNEF